MKQYFKPVIAVLFLSLVLSAGCNERPPEVIYSYNADEIAGGIFGNLNPSMTMNKWLMNTSWEQISYDDWKEKEKNFLYKDNKLTTPFKGSDIIEENTIIYCNFPLNGQGKKIGEITGTITLTDIPGRLTKVHIQNYRYSYEKWWSFIRKIDMSEVTGTSAALNWSLPVYQSFAPNLSNSFILVVLPGDSLKPYNVPVRTSILLNNANGNIGDLGTVSIKGVTLSGTINITYQGEPVPYIEIYANYPVLGMLNHTCLSEPEPNAPWSVTFAENPNSELDIHFQIFGFKKKDWENNDFLFDISASKIIYVINNQNVSGIVLDLGDQ